MAFASVLFDYEQLTSAPWLDSHIVSWWQVQKFSATRFMEMVKFTQAIVEYTQKPGATFGGHPQDVEITRNWAIKVEEECTALGLRMSARMAHRVTEEIANLSVIGLQQRMAELQQRLLDEMEEVLFMFIPSEQAGFYDCPKLLGEDVIIKWPSLQFDIAEAGNCYATGRSTAVVFHLMRIKILPAKDPHTVELSEVSANLYAVKLAWRNEVMHPKDTYTLEEADNLIRQVRIFMQNLAKVV